MPNALAALRCANFRLYALGNVASLLGGWAQRVVVFWLVWRLTGSTAVLGVLAMCDLAPAILGSALGGGLMDRWNEQRLAIWLQWMSALPPLLLLMASLAGGPDLLLILAATALAALATGVDHPVRLSLIGRLVPPERLPSAVALNSMLFNLSRMIGPMLAGLAIAADLLVLVFALNAASFLVFGAMLTRLTCREREPATHGNAGEVRGWCSLLRVLPRQQGLALIQLAVLAFCLRPVLEMLPAFAQRLAGAGGSASDLFALATSCVGLGAICGAACAPALRSVRAIAGCGILASGAVVAFTWVAQPVLALVLIGIAAAALLAGSIATQISMQLAAPAAIRGRVLALYTMILRGAPAVGSLSVGVLAHPLGLGVTFAVLAVPAAAVSLLMLRGSAGAAE